MPSTHARSTPPPPSSSHLSPHSRSSSSESSHTTSTPIYSPLVTPSFSAPFGSSRETGDEGNGQSEYLKLHTGHAQGQGLGQGQEQGLGQISGQAYGRGGYAYEVRLESPVDEHVPGSGGAGAGDLASGSASSGYDAHGGNYTRNRSTEKTHKTHPSGGGAHVLSGSLAAPTPRYASRGAAGVLDSIKAYARRTARGVRRGNLPFLLFFLG